MAPLFKCLEASFELFVPLVIAGMINIAVPEKNFPYLLRMGLLLLGLAVIGFGCSTIAQYFSAWVATRVGRDLRNDLFSHLQRLSYREIDREGTAALITRMSSDINQVESGVNLTLRLFLRSPFIVIGAVVMACRLNLRASLSFFVVVPVLTLVVFGIMRITMPMYRKVQQNLEIVTKTTRENLLGVRVVRAFDRQRAENQEFQGENDALTLLQIQVGRISALLNPLTYVIINLGIVALLYFGGQYVNQGLLRNGDVVALVNYMSQILVELIKLANLIIQITRAIASMKRVDAVFQLHSSIETGKTEKSVSESALLREGGTASSTDSDIPVVQFENVSFSYGSGESEAAALDNISFSVRRGQSIGIIGGTGAGKSTLVNLIPRFYEATHGAVRVDGRDVRETELSGLRKKISVVPQKSVLFAGTIRENLLWGKKDATEEELWQALDIAQAREIVEGKTERLWERVEQEGRNFSGGQRQRLCIARALVARPEILILDDSLSALDFATDRRLRNALRSAAVESTVFLVSQRVSSVREADQILVLDEGKLVGAGTHQELFHGCSVYREICLSQLSREEAEK